MFQPTMICADCEAIFDDPIVERECRVTDPYPMYWKETYCPECHSQAIGEYVEEEE